MVLFKPQESVLDRIEGWIGELTQELREVKEQSPQELQEVKEQLHQEKVEVRNLQRVSNFTSVC